MLPKKRVSCPLTVWGEKKTRAVLLSAALVFSSTPRDSKGFYSRSKNISSIIRHIPSFLHQQSCSRTKSLVISILPPKAFFLCATLLYDTPNTQLDSDLDHLNSSLAPKEGTGAQLATDRGRETPDPGSSM